MVPKAFASDIQMTRSLNGEIYEKQHLIPLYTLFQNYCCLATLSSHDTCRKIMSLAKQSHT